MSNPRHYDHLGHASFVTFSTYRRQPHLDHAAAKCIVQWGIDGMRKHFAVTILRYVIMLTHVHLVLVRPIHLTLMNLIKSFKSVTTRTILADAGLVLNATDWKWSSARRYVGLRETGIEIDQVELEDAGTLIW